jgi:hypothetical protein
MSILSQSPLFHNVRVRIATILALVSLLVALCLNILEPFGRSIAETTNTLASTFFALLSAGLSIYHWYTRNPANPVRKVWGTLAIGLSLWGVAEVLWSFLTIRGDEIPYPSVADGFWLLGYIVIFIALYLFYKTIQATPGAVGLALVLGFTIVYVVLGLVFVVGPIILEPVESGQLLEKALNILYPVSDLALLIGAALIALSLAGGAFSWSWAFIAIGFLSISFSDMAFVYADWNGLYYPDGVLTALTILVDMTNVLGYIALAVGLYVQIEFTARAVEEPLDIRIREISTLDEAYYKKIKIVLFVGLDHKVVTANPALAYLLPKDKDFGSVAGKQINQVLNTEFERFQKVLDEIARKGFAQMDSLILLNGEGEAVTAKLSGVANYDEKGRYNGADIILTVLVKNDSPQSAEDNLEQPDSRSLDEKLVEAFVVEKIHALYMITVRFGGINVAKSLQRTVNTHAQQLGSSIHMDGPNLVLDAQSHQHNLEIYRKLLRAAINYSISITPISVISRLIEKMESELDPELVEAGKRAGLYGLHID